MKKIGILCLALVLALGTMGVGYAKWTDSVRIDGTVETGDSNAQFRQAVSNDDGNVCPKFCIDGYWLDNVDIGDGGGDPTACQEMGEFVARTDNVAKTTVTGACGAGNEGAAVSSRDLYKELTVTITNAYPCYYATVFFNIFNTGTVPEKVKIIKLVSADGNTVDQALEVGTIYYVDADTGIVRTTSFAEADFSLLISNDKGTLYHVFDPYVAHVDTAAGSLCIHVLDGAEESTSYAFTIEVVVRPYTG